MTRGYDSELRWRILELLAWAVYAGWGLKPNDVAKAFRLDKARRLNETFQAMEKEGLVMKTPTAVDHFQITEEGLLRVLEHSKISPRPVRLPHIIEELVKGIADTHADGLPYLGQLEALKIRKELDSVNSVPPGEAKWDALLRFLWMDKGSLALYAAWSRKQMASIESTFENSGTYSHRYRPEILLREDQTVNVEFFEERRKEAISFWDGLEKDLTTRSFIPNTVGSSRVRLAEWLTRMRIGFPLLVEANRRAEDLHRNLFISRSN